MEFETSNKQAVYEKKPHIKRGYYKGQLLEVKKHQREDGVEIESMYGKRLILVWAVHEEASGAAIMHKEELEFKDIELKQRSYK